MDISVVLPCLNEAETIRVCIEKAKKQINGLNINGEVIVADNGSSDNSIKIAKECDAKVIHVKEKGYGNAVKSGVKASSGKYILIADSDDSYDLNDLPRFYNKITEGYDLVQGCRLPGGGGGINKGAMPITHRLIGNPLFSFLTKYLHGTSFNDVYCGMKILKKDFYENINFFSGGMVFCLEILIKTKIMKAKVAELPITLHKDGRKLGKSHLRTISDGLQTLKFILICCPKILYFFPSIFLLVVSLLSIFVNYYFKFYFEKFIFLNLSLLFLSIQFFMLGIYSALRAEVLGLYKTNWLSKFFKVFKLRFAIMLSLMLIVLSFFFQFSDYQIFNEMTDFILFNFLIIFGITILANSLFISLLVLNK